MCKEDFFREMEKFYVVVLMVITGAYTCDKVSQSYASKPKSAYKTEVPDHDLYFNKILAISISWYIHVIIILAYIF